MGTEVPNQDSCFDRKKSESEVAQSCPTLGDPMDCRLPGSSVHGVFQARGLEWGAIAFSKMYKVTNALHMHYIENEHTT